MTAQVNGYTRCFPNADGHVPGAGGFTLVPAGGSAFSKLSDGNPSSYIYATVDNAWTAVCRLENVTLAANERIGGIRLGVQVRASSGTVPLRIGVDTRGIDEAAPRLNTFANATTGAPVVETAWQRVPDQDTNAEISEAQQANASLYLLADNNGLEIVQFLEAYLDVDIVRQPTAVVASPANNVTAPSGSLTVSWVYNQQRPPTGIGSPHPDEPQNRYWVKIFTPAQYTAGGFNPETSTPFWSSGNVQSGVSSYTPPASGDPNPMNLVAGDDYRVYVKVGKTFFGGPSNTTWWSDWVFSPFHVTSGPGVVLTNPTANEGVDGDADNTFTWTYTGDTGSDPQTQYQVRYRRVGTTAWTTIPITSSATSSHTFAAGTFTSGSYEWAARARGTIGGGIWSDWTSPETFQIDRAPSAPSVIGPTTAAARDRTIHFSWEFNDADLGDEQSWFIIRYRLVGSGTWLYAPTALGSTSPDSFYDMPAGTIGADGTYEYQVQVMDQNSVLSPWSNVTTFQAFSAPSVTVTSPGEGATITNQNTTVSWSFSGSVGQEAYEVRRVNQNSQTPSVVYWSSGTIAGAAASRSVFFDTNNRDEYIQVRVRQLGVWSTWDANLVHIAFVPAPAPTIIVAADEPEARIVISATNPAPGGGQAAAVSNELWRRCLEEIAAGDPDGTMRIAVGLALNFSYSDYGVRSGKTYEYMARGVTAAGGSGDSAWTP